MGILDRFKRKIEEIVAKVLKILGSQEKKKEAKNAVAEALKKKEVVDEKKPKATASATPKPKTPPKNVKEKISLAYRVLLRPVVTEKAAHLQSNGQYVFEVATGANKNEVAKAVQISYGVTSVSVNIVTVNAKTRRFGRRMGMTRGRKKAIVTLKQGEKIELFESV